MSKDEDKMDYEKILINQFPKWAYTTFWLAITTALIAEGLVQAIMGKPLMFMNPMTFMETLIWLVGTSILVVFSLMCIEKFIDAEASWQ